MPSGDEVRIGTRRSRLALRQAEEAAELLRARFPGIAFSVVELTTSGEKMDTDTKSRFTKELEDALLEGRIDIAVHSVKDMELELPDGLKLAAITKRRDSRDVLITKSGLKLQEFPAGARIGTGSLRRKAQLLYHRGDLDIMDIRGNIDTRLGKFEALGLDALVLAKAGLERIGWLEGAKAPAGWAAGTIPFKVMLPAAGQGALGIEVRQEDGRASEMASSLDEPVSHREIEEERRFMKEIGATCRTPAGVLAEIKEKSFTIEGAVYSVDGSRCIREALSEDLEHSEGLGAHLARMLLEKGAEEILLQCR